MGWKNSHGSGKAGDTITSGLEGAWTYTPVKWSHDFFDNMYRHWQVRRMRRKAGIVVKDLFDVFMDDTGLMPDEWRREANFAGEGEGAARVISDYIAGMTDRFALQEHRKIMDPTLKS